MICTHPIISAFTSLQAPLPPSPFAGRIPPNTPLPRSSHGVLRSSRLFVGTAFVEVIKVGKACEFPGQSAACFLCHFSLINQRCRKVDTALCVSLSPAQQRPRLCPRAGALGKRREGNHPSSRLHMSAVIPSPFRWLSPSPPVFRISTEAAAQMNKNHCPCHLPWCRPPLLRENKTYTGS